MRKSASVVRMIGSGRVSVMRTRQESARLMGTSAYFCKRLSTDSTLLSRSKAAITARRRSRALSAGAPRAPRRWKASERTASQVRQGGGWPGACVAAHWWWESRRLSKATKKPASTSTFLAIARSFQVALLSCAQIGRQAVQRADQIGNGSKRRGLTPSGSSGALQALANDVGLRTPAVARFDLDLGYERLGQSYGKSFHTISVLRCCRECKTNLDLTTSTSVRKHISGFVALMVVVWTCYLATRKRDVPARRIDLSARMVFPTTFSSLTA